MTGLYGPGQHALSFSDASGVPREHLLSVPEGTVRGLVVMFHPFGGRPELVMNGGTDDGYLIRPLTGAASVADALGLVVLAPRSRGRELDGVSLGWKGHLDAVWAVSESLRQSFGLTSVGAGGLSMGGLEALVFAGQHPHGVPAAWAANPIVNLASWRHHLSGTDSPESEPGLAELIDTEVGGSPHALPLEYAARSPFDYVESLSRVRLRLVWSPADTVIPNQRTVHAGQLATRIRERGGDVIEIVVTHFSEDSSIDNGRFAHEACDVREGMAWLAEQLNYSHQGGIA